MTAAALFSLLARTSSAQEDGGAPSIVEPAAAAAEVTAPLEVAATLSTPEVHGFVSQGFILSIENEYLAAAKQGSLEFSEVGFNLTQRLSDSLSIGVQLFAHDLGPFGNFSPQLDWFHLNYRPYDWLGLRLGNSKMPFGLYNEVNDIDVARVPILLPQSLYQIDHREFLFAQTGGEAYGYMRLGAAGALEYRIYGGTLFAQPPGPPAPGITVTAYKVPYVYGGRLLWFSPLEGLLAGFSAQAVRLDTDLRLDPAVRAALEAQALLPPGLTDPLRTKFRVIRWIASLQYQAGDLDLSAEYSRWTGEFYTQAPALFPPKVINERYYLMASYQVTPWFTPGAYYSAYFPNVEDREGREAHQHDIAVTTRYDLTPNWLIKLEGHLMFGTAALDNRALNAGREPPALAPTWAVFLLKSTAYF